MATTTCQNYNLASKGEDRPIKATEFKHDVVYNLTRGCATSIFAQGWWTGTGMEDLRISGRRYTIVDHDLATRLSQGAGKGNTYRYPDPTLQAKTPCTHVSTHTLRCSADGRQLHSRRGNDHVQEQLPRIKRRRSTKSGPQTSQTWYASPSFENRIEIIGRLPSPRILEQTR